MSQSYNFAADSLNWSNINTSLMLRLVKNFNLTCRRYGMCIHIKLNSSGQPVRVNIPRWRAGKGIGRLSSTGTSFSYTFNNNTFKRNKNGKDKDRNKNNGRNGDSGMPDDPMGNLRGDDRNGQG